MTQEKVGLLSSIKAFVLDMDGTIYLGDHLLPGAKDFVKYLQDSNIPFLFLTNNSSQHRKLYAEKLNRMGLNVDPSSIFTSGEATATFLQQHFPDIMKIDLYGTSALEEEFASYGFRLEMEDPQAIVLGFDTTFTYDKLWHLCDEVRSGLPYFATHPDINCPLEDGVMPDIGAIIAFVEASTGRLPDYVIGKPNPPIVKALIKRLGCSENEICMVGDRLYTDVALGQAGLRTVLVLSGETKAGDLPDSPYKPDLVIDNVGELLTLLEKC